MNPWISAAASSGSSAARKCPPFPGSFQYRIAVQARSASDRGNPTMEGSWLSLTLTGIVGISPKLDYPDTPAVWARVSRLDL
jgi:hypothetical protein